MEQIQASKLEEMIRNQMLKQGLTSEDIDDNLVEQIKEKIKNQVNQSIQKKPETQIVQPESEGEIVDISSDTPTDTPGRIPSSIEATTQQTIDPEIYKKEGELNQKEKELQNKEEELKIKEEELIQRQKELSYKPKLPKIVNETEPEKLFVFSQNELSMGSEGLTLKKFKSMHNPDEERNMEEIWINKASQKAEMYLVKFESIGYLEFDPLQGTTNFIEKRFDNPPFEIHNNIPAGNDERMDVTSVPEPPLDAIEPKKDMSLPMADNMLFNKLDIDNLIQQKVEYLLRKYLNKNA